MRCNHHRFNMRMLAACICMALPLALAAFSNAALAAGGSPQELLEKFRCTICHAESEAGAGPAWADIATHYRGKPKANKLIADKIRSGAHGGGPWHMPPHPEVSKADAATMARYILAIKN
jgi:cytochrome c